MISRLRLGREGKTARSVLRAVLACGIAMGVAVCSLAQAVEPQTPSETERQLFRYRFAPNTPSKYRVSAQMSGVLPLLGGMPVEKAVVDMVLVLKVRDLRADGNAETSIDVEAFRAEMDGQTLPLPLDRLRASLRDVAYVVNPQGEVVERKGTTSAPLSIPLPGVEPNQLPLILFQLVFPREAISPGQDWTYTRAMSSMPNDSPAQFTARWVKDEPVSDVAASLFTQKMRWSRAFKADIFDAPTTDPSLTVKQIEQNISGEAQVWFSRDGGQLVKSLLTMEFQQQTRLLDASGSGSAPAPIRLTATIQVIREDLAPRSNETQNGTGKGL